MAAGSNGFGEQALKALREAGTEKPFKAGDRLPTGVLLRIERGRAQLRSPEGRIAAAVVGAGQWLGPVPTGSGSVYAVEAGTALVLDESTLAALEPAVAARARQAGATTLVSACVQRARVAAREGRAGRYLRGYIAQSREADAATGVASAVIGEVIEKIPRLPAYALELVRLLEDEAAEIDEVVRLASTDPSLVAEILKTVNSARYGLPKRVDDFKMAIALLGFDEVHRITFETTVRGVMPDNDAVREMQNHSVAVSRMAHDLAKRADLGRVSMISILGLLHDIGGAVIFILQRRNTKIREILELLDRPALGARLLRHWQFPERLVDCVAAQRQPEYQPVEALDETLREPLAALHLAHLCDAFLGGAEEAELPAGYAAGYLHLLQRPERTIKSVVNRVILPAMKQHKFKFTSPLADGATAATKDASGSEA